MFIGTEQSKYVVHFQTYDVTTINKKKPNIFTYLIGVYWK